MGNLQITALGGLVNSGKSEILNKLIEFMETTLINKNGTQVHKYEVVGPKGTMFDIDQTVLFERVSDGKKIYIYTSGDDRKIIEQAIIDARKLKADMLITAYRTSNNDTQTPIVNADPYAYFLATHKYMGKGGWNKVNSANQNLSIQDKYVERLEASI